MIGAIIIVIASLIGLMALHEAGHFLLAKKFKVKVEEFGVGYPPRIWGKKIKGTIYSLNWLPFGAFVKILGEDDNCEKKQGSFASKKIWQRALILLGGVVSFWLIAFVLLWLTIGSWGAPTAVPDGWQGKEQARVLILAVAKDSPAEKAGIKSGDKIINLQSKPTDKVQDVLDFVSNYKGREMGINLQRGERELNVSLTPRPNPPEGEGAMGVALARVVNFKYPWYEAPWEALKITGLKTKEIPLTLYDLLKKKASGEKVSGIEFMGPVGLGKMMGQAMESGVANFLMLVIMVSIWMALFNLLPIPALDGGRLLFLIIEAVRRKPVSQLIEQRITSFFFFLLVALMAFVTVNDIIKLF
ncbi:MAG: site-2 protease family protein [Patescibacteria group bacterium]|nr:site-2 protease family protein [Patescibacteria group bacterium]